MQATNLGECCDPPDRLHRPRVWRVLAEQKMKTGSMVIREVRTQRSPQRVLAEDENVIQAFSSDRPDEPFDGCPLPRRPWSAENLIDVNDLDLPSEFFAENAVAITKQIFRCGIEGERFEYLLRCTLCRRMRCHVEVDDTPPVMRQNNEDVEDFNANGMDGEEVNRRIDRPLPRSESSFWTLRHPQICLDCEFKASTQMAGHLRKACTKILIMCAEQSWR